MEIQICTFPGDRLRLQFSHESLLSMQGHLFTLPSWLSVEKNADLEE